MDAAFILGSYNKCLKSKHVTLHLGLLCNLLNNLYYSLVLNKVGVRFVSTAAGLPLVTTTNSAVFQLTRGQSVDDDVNKKNFCYVVYS